MRLQLALDQPVDEAGLIGLLRGDGVAGRGHLQRLADSGDARQPLGAAGAGQEAELDLGHAQLRRRDGDPVMAGERDLEAAAEGGAVDRGDDRLGAILDDVDDLGEHRHLHRLAELGDVGAGEEGLALADDHHRLDRLVAVRLLDRLDQPLAHRMAERVDRRVVRGDDEDVAVAVGRDRAHWEGLLRGARLRASLRERQLQGSEAGAAAEGLVMSGQPSPEGGRLI